VIKASIDTGSRRLKGHETKDHKPERPGHPSLLPAPAFHRNGIKSHIQQDLKEQIGHVSHNRIASIPPSHRFRKRIKRIWKEIRQAFPRQKIAKGGERERLTPIRGRGTLSIILKKAL
jgi:hypothetical protein